MRVKKPSKSFSRCSAMAGSPSGLISQANRRICHAAFRLPVNSIRNPIRPKTDAPMPRMEEEIARTKFRMATIRWMTSAIGDKAMRFGFIVE